MKKATILFFALVSITLLSCKDNAVNKVNEGNLSEAKAANDRAKMGIPEMTFISKDYDFGTIDEGDNVNAVFKFENTGKGDLIITKAKAACGCTIPEWPKDEIIKPGEKGEIKALFKSSGKPNKQNKSITLTTNTITGKEILHVKGFVTPDPNSKRNKNNLISKKTVLKK